ncbi:MAG TPA: alpha/beta fold hydrolase [Gaiellaceae bacterium]|jgi:proline iminopeptidase|nr:alpha/beta fold hydrolase [Gaiellaceae bacterium]
MHVDVDGTRLWFDVDGSSLFPSGPGLHERPTAVLLHGGPGSFDHSYFKPDFARLAAVAQVVYLDLPGHGRSDWGDPAEWSFDLCGDAVRAFCDAIGIARPVVLGHSLGGFVALAYALRNPGHAGALVLQSTFARFDLRRIVEEFRRRGGDEVAAVVERFYGGERASVTREEWTPCFRLFGPWVPGDEERSRMVLNPGLNAPGLELMRRFDVVDRLSRLECPTLVCVGELDPITSVAAARELYDALPEGLGRLEVVEGAGHFTWKDAPDRYWPLLSEFITNAPAATRRRGDEYTLDTPLVRSFVAEVRAAIDGATSPEDACDAIRPHFAELLADPQWLPDEYQEAVAESGMGGGIGTWLLFRAGDGSLSLVSLVVPPGAQTPIHDHLAWGLVGLYRGMQDEEVYAERDGGLELVDRRELAPGDFYTLLPPRDDIHRVRTTSPETSVSIHLLTNDIGCVWRHTWDADSGAPAPFRSGYVNTDCEE